MAYQKKTNFLFGKRITKPYQTKIKKLLSENQFFKFYLYLSFLVLLLSVVFWSLLGSKIQLGNADQIINSQLFSNTNSFQNAVLPASHTFLIKWPIFYLVSLFGTAKGALMALTVLTVLLTIGLFVLILRSIEKRPMYLGTICLALASVLMLIPAQPYPGGLLPVNMAMIATRNLEYIVYIFALMLLVRFPRLRSRSFWIAIALLSILAASDKLFLIISVGGALVSMVYYSFLNRNISDNLISKWLVATIAAGVGSLVLVWLITISKITSFTHSGSLSPYGLVTNAHKAILGIFYGISSVFTNLGANPAANTTIIRSIPNAVINNFFSLSFLGFIINLIILIFGLFLGYKLINDSFAKKNKKPKLQDDSGSKLAILLIWTSVSAFIVFVVSNHDYSVDSRYMGIVLFAIFVAIAVYSSKQKLQPEILALIGLIIGLSAISGTYFAWQSYRVDMAAMNDQNNRNQVISEVLEAHPVDILVGDYWRVVPIKLASSNKQNIMPLDGCTIPKQTLNSTVWPTNLNKNSFAYLLSLSGGNLTNYPHCSINQVVNYYGKPNSSQVIEGSLSSPKEVLLFYGQGMTKKIKTVTTATSPLSTVSVVDVSSLPAINCDDPTVVNIVAHVDDDLLFMNPDILNEIKNGYCERTIFITAGDAGSGSFYYLSRQSGSEAAYAEMTNNKDIWNQRTIKIASNKYVTLSSLNADPKISLVFMHLPDGGLYGQGFKTYDYQSIDKLYSGSISNITSVDSQSNYSLSSLETALVNLMILFGPSEIRTQSTYSGGNGPIKDHADHNTVGRLVTKAAAAFNQNQFSGLTAIPVEYYEGYPIRDNPINVSGADLVAKQNADFAYANFDGAACNSLIMCNKTKTYSGYLQRQYRLNY